MKLSANNELVNVNGDNYRETFSDTEFSEDLQIFSPVPLKSDCYCQKIYTFNYTHYFLCKAEPEIV